MDPSRFKFWVVMKSPTGLAGANALLGCFVDDRKARAACVGAGRFTIFKVDPNRAYQPGTLLDVEIIDILDHREMA